MDANALADDETLIEEAMLACHVLLDGDRAWVNAASLPLFLRRLAATLTERADSGK